MHDYLYKTNHTEISKYIASLLAIKACIDAHWKEATFRQRYGGNIYLKEMLSTEGLHRVFSRAYDRTMEFIHAQLRFVKERKSIYFFPEHNRRDHFGNLFMPILEDEFKKSFFFEKEDGFEEGIKKMHQDISSSRIFKEFLLSSSQRRVFVKIGTTFGDRTCGTLYKKLHLLHMKEKSIAKKENVVPMHIIRL